MTRPATALGVARTRAVVIEGPSVEDAVNGALALLAVAGALVRRAADQAARRRPALLRLPASPGPLGGLRALRGLASRTLRHPASTAVGAIAAAADALVPEVTRGILARLDVPALVREYVDLDRLAALLNVDAVVTRVDLDAVIDRLDLDALAARLDLDPLVDKVDIARVLDRVDLDAVVARVDLDAVIDRLDLDALAARIDLDSAVARVDLDAVVSRVDLDRAVDRVDVDRVIARTDVVGLARYVIDEIDLPGLLRSSTDSVTSEMVRGVRDQGVDADRAVERVVDRLLHRTGRRTATVDGSPQTGRTAPRDQR